MERTRGIVMDFSNITGMYSDSYSTAANQAASNLQNKLSGVNYSKATDDELMDACKQFEAYFVEQMFKEMLKTIPSESEGSGSTRSMLDYFKDEMVQNIAEETTNQNGGLGLAQMLYEQMRRNYGLDSVSAEAIAAELPNE